MESVKSVAKAFLYLDIKTTHLSPIVVQHPFFDSAFVGLGENGANKVGNIIDSEADLNAAREIKVKQIEEAKDLLQLSMYITKPYKLAFLKYIEGYLSPADIGRYIAANWSLIEHINTDNNVTKYEIIRYIEMSDKSSLMTEAERTAMESWPDEITVYRGVTEYNKKHIKGLSWTLNIKVAEYFATRFKRKQVKEAGEAEGVGSVGGCGASGSVGRVYQATIKKEDILAYITGRSEEEVIVNIDGLKDIKEIRTI